MKKILIYNSGGGLGDSIQIIPLLLSIKNHFRKSEVFYLGAHPNHKMIHPRGGQTLFSKGIPSEGGRLKTDP